MSAAKSVDLSMAGQLCLSCGLCCNGVLFADVKLLGDDEPGRLRELGLQLKKRPGAHTTVAAFRFTQPCAMLDGCRCRIYPHRPAHCARFECALLQSTLRRNTSFDQASKIIHQAQGLVRKVGRLLSQLGDYDEHLPLRKRVSRTGVRLAEIGCDRPTAEIAGALSLAAHDLNFVLMESFYPGE